jgi:prepilin-type N-terminal cleavage/methylation domain-containing protein
MTARARPSRAAFTIIEILCVVVILAIAAAVVLANLSNTGDFQAKGGARVVLTDLLYAQNQAVATQQNVYVTFNNGSGTYSLCSALSPSVTYLTNPVSHGNYTTSIGSGALAGCTLSASLDGGTNMYFDELGVPHSCDSSGGTVAYFTTSGTVTVSCENHPITVSIAPNTGDLTVSQ